MKKILAAIFFSLLIAAAIAPALGASRDIKALFFYQENCRWCRMMDEVMDDPLITKILLENVRIVRVNIHGKEKLASEGMTGAELKKKYGIYWIPTMIFMDAGQKELLKIPGVVTKEDFKDLLCENVGVKSALCAK